MEMEFATYICLPFLVSTAEMHTDKFYKVGWRCYEIQVLVTVDMNTY